jgi:hypothetical protein
LFDFQSTLNNDAQHERHSWVVRAHLRAGSDMSEIPRLKDIRHVTDDPPPFLGRWPLVYGAVLCVLAAVIAGLYVFMREFTP